MEIDLGTVYRPYSDFTSFPVHWSVCVMTSILPVKVETRKARTGSTLTHAARPAKLPKEPGSVCLGARTFLRLREEEGAAGHNK